MYLEVTQKSGLDSVNQKTNQECDQAVCMFKAIAFIGLLQGDVSATLTIYNEAILFLENQDHLQK